MIKSFERQNIKRIIKETTVSLGTQAAESMSRLVDPADRSTRIQVEHPVTEWVTAIDMHTAFCE